MHFLDVVLILILNLGLILLMQRFQSRALDRKIKTLKNEVQELEDLVTAIIQEFEEVAGTLETETETDLSSEVSKGLEPIITPENPVFEIRTADSRHQYILDLNHRGLSVEEIAKELRIGRGEVSLILGLYQRS